MRKVNLSILLKLSVIVGCLCISPIAFAQDDAASQPENQPMDPQPDPNATGDAPVDTAAATSDGLYPLRFAARPLTLLKGYLRGDLDFSIGRLAGSTVVGIPTIGAGFGIMDDLEVGANVVPLTLSPKFDYGVPSGPEIYAMYRFMRGSAELALRAGVIIPVKSGSDVDIEVGVPVLLRLGDSLRLDTGVLADLIPNSAKFYAKINVPLRLAIQVSDQFYLGPFAGLTLYTEKAFGFGGDQVSIPVGAFAAYTLASKAGSALADIGAQFGFTDVKHAGDAWTILLSGRVFFNLM